MMLAPWKYMLRHYFEIRVLTIKMSLKERFLVISTIFEKLGIIGWGKKLRPSVFCFEENSKL
jgi:hypothetical protein